MGTEKRLDYATGWLWFYAKVFLIAGIVWNAFWSFLSIPVGDSVAGIAWVLFILQVSLTVLIIFVYVNMRRLNEASYHANMVLVWCPFVLNVLSYGSQLLAGNTTATFFMAGSIIPGVYGLLNTLYFKKRSAIFLDPEVRSVYLTHGKY